MADNNNFYSWLDLPVEPFEKDQAKLLSILERKKIEWASHKTLSIQNRANIHYEKIKAAINNPAEWEKIYKEYLQQINVQLDSRIIYYVSDNKIESSNVEDLAKNMKVSTSYVEKYCKEKHIEIIEGNSSPEIEPLKLDELYPVTKTKLSSPQKFINELGEPDLFALLANPEYIGLHLSESSSKEKVVEALENMRAKWKNIPQSGPKGTQRSHLDKVYSGFVSFLKSAPFSDYVQFLKCEKAKDILNNIRKANATELNESAFNQTLSRLSEHIEDADKAKRILITYCTDNNISYPLPRKKLAMCPFCSTNFERTEPIQKKCPVCGASLVVQCPKCKAEKHLLIDTECDGINIRNYPMLAARYKKAEEFYSLMSFDAAEIELKGIEEKWPGYPDTSDLRKKIDDFNKKYGSDFKQIAAHCSKKEYYSARSIIERIDSQFPNFKSGYAAVHREIEEAEQAFSLAMKNEDKATRLAMLMSVYELVADFTKLNMELQKYPVQPITAINAVADSDTGVVTVSWSSTNVANSVTYKVYRKQDGIISAIGEGTEITSTQGNSCSDTEAKEGKVYYYAVYAIRGPVQSPLAVMNEPVVALKTPVISVTPGDCCIDLSWPTSDIPMRVFYSENRITNPGDGKEVTGVSSAGAAITKLVNGKSYSVSAYKCITHGKREFCSNMALVPDIVPVKPIAPPKVVKSIGSSAGEYILTNEDSGSTDTLSFFFSEELAGIGQNSVISLYDMERKTRRLNVTQTGKNTYKVNLSGIKQMYVYPAYEVTGTLTVGEVISLSYIDPINVTGSVSGKDLCLFMDKWPEGARRIIICYDFDSPVDDVTDCHQSNKVTVTQTEYNKSKSLVIPNVKEKKYYITIFAHKNTDYIPVGMLEYDHLPASNIMYSFKVGLLGGLSITLKNNIKYRPPLVFAVGDSCVPLRKESALFSYDIPENPSAPATETISIPKSVYTPQRNHHGKLLCQSSNFCLLVEGSSKLK